MSLALWFQRRRFLMGFYHIWAWQPSWSCDPDAPNILSFPWPMKAPHEIWLRLAQRFWWRRSLKMVDGRTTTVHAYTISSPRLKIGSTLNPFSWFRFSFFLHQNLLSILQRIFSKLNKNKHCFEHLGGYARQNQQIDTSEDQIRRVFDDKWRIIFSEQFSIKNICCGYSLESSQRGICNEYPQHMF